MEFPFDVNFVLPYEVTIINGDYRILNQGQSARVFASDKLTSIIDAIGEASYKAQGLSGPVTTARKFRIWDHRLYIVKRANDNNNLGSVVGILKVGAKHLYIYDTNGQVHERTPLCLLDFYVHESKQRLGYGKKLFDAMLQHEKCASYELAIDRPSNKCLGFLQKHYHLTGPIHQVNNFVVYPGFFTQSPVTANGYHSASKQRQEISSWLLPSEREYRRPYSEQHEFGRSERTKTMSDGNDLFGNRRQVSITARDERSPVSSYTTSYGQHYNSTGMLHQQTNTNERTYMPRTYSQIFHENNAYPNLRRHNTNPIIPIHSHPLPTNDYHRIVETVPVTSKPEPLTSIYTFPSLIKPSNNWRQQSSTIGSSSTAWNLFGVHRLLN